MSTETQEFTTPSGATVTFCDPSQVKERDRRKVTHVVASLQSDTLAAFMGADKPSDISMTDINPKDLALADELNDALTAALIVSWSYDFPVSIDALLDLTAEDYDAIGVFAAPFIEALSLQFQPTPDPASPTAPANA